MTGLMAGGRVTWADARAARVDTERVGDRPRHLERPDNGGGERGHRRLAVIGILLAMLLGGALRAVWADAYLPWDYHWDEMTNVEHGEAMLAERTVDPGFYNYPALIFAVQAMVLVPAEVSTDYSPEDRPVLDRQTRASALVDQPGALRAMRWGAGVIPGVVTIAAAGAIAWLASRRWWVSTIAASIVAISAIDLRFGIYVTPDALTGAASTLAALGAAAVAIRPSRRLYLLTGVAIGLAGAAKYNAAAVAIGLVAAHVVVLRRPLAERRPLLEAGAVAVVVFCLTNPGAVLNPYELVRGVGSEANHYSTGHFGDEGSSPLFNGAWLLRTFGVGVVLAAASLLSTSDRVRRVAVVLFAQCAGYFVFISLFPVRFPRNLIPMTGPLAAAAALGVLAIAQNASSRWARNHRSPALAVTAVMITVALLAAPIRAAGAAMRTVGEDPWSEAQAWIDNNVRDGSTIAVENRAPFLDDSRYDLIVTERLSEHDAAYYDDRDLDYAIGVSETFQPYLDFPDAYPTETETYREVLDPDCILREFEGAGQRIVIASRATC